jgi:serine/threonine protein kinase
MSIDPKRVKEIFLEAAELSEESARAAYLDKACGGDAGVRARVEALLRAHDPEGSFLGTPAAVVPDPGHDATQALTGTPDPGAAAVQTTDGENDPSDDESLAFLSPPTRPDALGRIGHYEVLQVLGRGGFGIVFRAFDEMLQRVVALKVMAPQLAATSPARKRFLREARSSAQVRHENVVQVYEVAEQPLPYLAMEFIPGETLQQKLDRLGPLDVPEVLRIGRQIAEGLSAAHATDLIHRDIKPGNVLLEGGQHKVKITDFGLARTADDASISQSGIIAGTPMYMAPEQAQGQTLDQRADLFSLGSVLYQMVTGRPPFRANTAVAVLKRVAEDKPRAIREIIPETPQWLCDIIAKLHAKNPDKRYQSAREVADVLADCEAQLKANARLKDYSRIPRPKSTPAGKWKWTAAAIVLLSIIALAATELAGVTHLFRGQQATREPISPSGGPTPMAAGSPEVPRKAADVVPFLIGSWNIERQLLEQKPIPDKDLDRAIRRHFPIGSDRGILTYDLIAGGKFLRGRGWFGDGTSGALFLHAFDPETKELRHWQAWSNGNADGPTAGLFNPDNHTLMWKHLLGNGIETFHQLDFVDSNKIRSRHFVKDASNTILRESRLMFTRAKQPLAIPSLPADPQRPEEMKVLDRLVGDWRNEITVTNFATPDKPKPKRETVRAKAESILGGRFVEMTETNRATGGSDYTLAWYDADAKKYREWFFRGRGYVLELEGTWDEATKTLTWTSPDGRLEGHWIFKSNDLREFRHLTKAFDGKVLNEVAGVSRRTTSPAVAPFTDADVQRIAALPAAEQVEEVRKELKRRNPGFDGKIEHKIEDGVVTEFRFVTDQVTDIAPIRVFDALRVLECRGTYTYKPNGLLTDLTPLEGMNLADLTYLNLSQTKVGDAGMIHFKDCKKLNQLHLGETPVGDAGLIHFKDCRALTHLFLNGTHVSDVGLAHFKGMPLMVLVIYKTGITDLSPLQGMPLETIRLTPKNITQGLDILGDMKRLKTIGIDYNQAWPAAEFWQRYDKGEFK